MVAVLTTYETDADVLRAIEVGATGYLLKDASRVDLVNAVRTAARGGTVLTPSVANRLLAPGSPAAAANAVAARAGGAAAGGRRSVRTWR
jgi:DNA-binding NarL/FixJ family response regulator